MTGRRAEGCSWRMRWWRAQAIPRSRFSRTSSRLSRARVCASIPSLVARPRGDAVGDDTRPTCVATPGERPLSSLLCSEELGGTVHQRNGLSYQIVKRESQRFLSVILDVIEAAL